MELAHIIAFNTTLIVAILVPGPSLLYLTQQSLRGGRSAGIAAALGLGLMASLWTLAALVGLESLFRIFPWAYALLKTVGALYLIWDCGENLEVGPSGSHRGSSTARRQCFFGRNAD